MWIETEGETLVNLDHFWKIDWQSVNYEDKVIGYQIFGIFPDDSIHVLGHLTNREDQEVGVYFNFIIAGRPQDVEIFTLKDLLLWHWLAHFAKDEAEEFEEWMEKAKKKLTYGEIIDGVKPPPSRE